MYKAVEIVIAVDNVYPLGGVPRESLSWQKAFGGHVVVG